METDISSRGAVKYEGVLSILLARSPRWAKDETLQSIAIELLAQSLGITCTDEEIQAEADKFRLEHRLLTYDATIEWLTENHLNGQSWFAQIKTDLLEGKLLSSSITAKDVESYFEQHSEEFARAIVLRIVVEDEGIAEELRLLVEEEGYSFNVLARRYSIEYAGHGERSSALRHSVFRFELPQPVAGFVFDASSKTPFHIRPVCIEKLWHLYKVFDTYPASLDTATEVAVRKRILQQRVGPFFESARCALLKHSD